jgi:hypothetical protein
MAEPLKTINYRGLLQFRIPASWTEASDKDGGGRYFAPGGGDTGVFRVSITSGTAQPGKAVDAIATSVLESYASQFGTLVQRLPSGMGMVSYDKSVEESGRPMVIRFWYLAQVILPNFLRIADFSYTLQAAVANDPRFIEERNLLDQEVKSAIFLSPNIEPKKPWWKPW